MRFSSLLLTAWCISWCISPAPAQTADMKVPGLGFAWDGRSQQIRPVRGIPGAAMLGDATASTNYASAVISPRQDLALVVSAADGRVQALRLSSGDAHGDIQDIPGLAPAPSRIVFSPSGTAALIFGSKLQLLSGLPDSPTVQDLALPPDAGAPTALAVSPIAISDDAQFVLFSTWLLAPGAAPLQLTLPAPVAVAAFRPGSPDAIALSPDGTVYQILNSAAPGNVRQAYAGEVRTADPVAVRVSTDGSQVYAANRLGILTSINLSTSSVNAVDCGCAPTGILPLTVAGLFRINEISDRPVMLFDVSTPTSRVWFIPADAPSTDSQRSGQ
jgi:hypothetical protein